MKLSLKIKWSNELAIAILFFGPQINYYIASLLNMNGLQTATVYIYAVLYAVGLGAYLINLRLRNAFFSFITMVFLILGSYLINDKVSAFMIGTSFFASSLPIMMMIYFPMYIMLIGKLDFCVLMNYLRKFSVVTLILGITAFYSYLFLHKSTPPDYMSFAYMMLNSIMISFMHGWRGNVVPFILSILAAFILFIVGCRGAVITLAVFLALYVLGFFSSENVANKKRMVLKLLLFAGIILVAVNAETILRIIALRLQAIGFNSRTVNTLLIGGGAFVESEGRQAIWSQAIENIGIIGKGLFGDRTVIINEYGNAAYAHNLLLEIMVDFGMFFGLLVAAALIIVIIWAFRVSRRSKTPALSKLTFAMTSILLIKHMISASFLTSFDFWFYMGLAVNIVINRKYILNGGYLSKQIEKEASS